MVTDIPPCRPLSLLATATAGLSDPFLSSGDACSLFSICLSIFNAELQFWAGKVVILALEFPTRLYDRLVRQNDIHWPTAHTPLDLAPLTRDGGGATYIARGGGGWVNVTHTLWMVPFDIARISCDEKSTTAARFHANQPVIFPFSHRDIFARMEPGTFMGTYS